jgi:hypothetical protein
LNSPAPLLDKKASTMTTQSKRMAIASAREAGFSDTEILKNVLSNIYGGNKRRELVVEWGELLGLEASEALHVAHAAGLIPSAHPPRKGGKPR